jgi:hypothetical protein
VVVPFAYPPLIGHPIKWIDVGTGLGTKLRRFVRLIASRLGPESLHLSMVDADYTCRADCTQELLQDVHPHVREARCEGMTLQEYVLKSASRISGQSIFLTATHFLYCPELVAPLIKLVALNGGTPRVVVFAACESPQSDFHRIRTLLLMESVSVAHSVLDNFTVALEDSGFSISRHDLGGQRCYIDRQQVMHDDTHWLFPFIVGCCREEFLQGDPGRREAVQNTVRKYVGSLKSDYLHVPDTALLAVSGEQDRKAYE